MKMNNQAGMTLIEVIIAIAILGIIVVAFLNMFMTGMLGIFKAGDKGEAYSRAQEDLDTRIGRRESIETEDLEVEFDGVTYIIPGGLVETEQFVQESKSQMEAFIPLVPTIKITPKVRFEGSSLPIEIDIVGNNTNFSSSSTAEFIDKFGNVAAPNPTISVTDATNATIELDSDFINSVSSYALRIITPITDEPDEVVRAKYSVALPNLVAVSEDSLYVSDNGSYWLKRSNLGSFPTFGSLKKINYGNGHFLVGGTGSTLLVYYDLLGWDSKTLITESQINDIEWSNENKEYYIAGESGTVKSSTTAESFNTMYQTTNGEAINGLSVTATGKVIAVGDDGHIAYSDDGTTFQESVITSGVDFNKVLAYNDVIGGTEFYIIVGDGGKIYRSIDAVNWSDIAITSTENINSVKYLPSSTSNIIAVGDNGLILTSTDSGQNFTENIYNSGTVNLKDIGFLVGTDDVFVVGNDQIIKSDDLNIWTPVTYDDGSVIDFTGENFMSITGK